MKTDIYLVTSFSVNMLLPGSMIATLVFLLRVKAQSQPTDVHPLAILPTT